jgi:hypothetical protein
MIRSKQSHVNGTKNVVLFYAIILITLSFPIQHYVSSELSDTESMIQSRNIPALNGDFKASEFFNGIIEGQSSEDSKGLLGTAMGKADINGDDYMDIYISAQSLEGVADEKNSGKCYIWYGSGGNSFEDIDLDSESPDLIIRGSKLDSKAVHTLKTGDIDNDGYTDIVIGNPDQPESGKVFILWGSESGWPSEITLPPVEGDEPNAFPVGFLRTSNHVVISGQVTTNVLGRQLGYDIEVGDLDNDTYDDVVFSFYGWNTFMIGWGGPNRFTFGNDLTYVKEGSDTSRFGNQIEMGDLDNNGILDLVVSAPNLDDEGRGMTRNGAVFVYYNPGRMKGNASLSSRDSRFLRPLVWGLDSYDNLGSTLLLEDINNDDKDDIIYGIPGDDGPQNGRMNSGQIQAIHGDDITSFPASFIGSQSSDVKIYGENGKQGDYPGDRTGSSFSMGDIDGDSELEVLISFPGRDGLKGETETGLVSLYETRDTLSIAGGISDLKNIQSRMRIWGDDTEDNFGQGVTLFDFNSDGIDDLFISAPSADGPENRRAGCGEVYFSQGNPVSIGAISIGGDGTTEDGILSGAGNVQFEIPVRIWPDADIIEDIYLYMDPGGMNISFRVGKDDFEVMNDPFGTVEAKPETGIQISQNRADLIISFETSIFFKIESVSDILVKVETQNGDIVSRFYPERLMNYRNLSIGGNEIIFRNGKKTLTSNDWFANGDTLSISGHRATYDNLLDREYQGEGLTISLFDQDELISSALLAEQWIIETTLSMDDDAVYHLSLDFRMGTIPPGYPQADLPSLGEKKSMNIRMDLEAPLSPSDVRTFPDKTRETEYDDDQDWTIEWNDTVGTTLDGNGSGVRNFQISVDGSDWNSSMQEGGLWVTYFQGREFNEIYRGYQGIEDDMDHSESEWGQFAPVTELYYKDYSIRYHGWFLPDASRDHKFGLTGSGAAVLMIDGKTIIESQEIHSPPISDPIFLEEGKVVPIILLFQNSMREEGSWLTLRLEDSTGSMETIQTSQLYYPSNRSEVEVLEEGSFNIEVRSVDWVGLASDSAITEGIIDDEGPRFDLSRISRWYSSVEPSLDIAIMDPDLRTGFGSGIDIDRIQSRRKPVNDVSWTNWTDCEDVEINLTGPDGPISVNATFDLVLDSDWKGSVQFRAYDMVGNMETSSIVDIGIDLEGPEFDVLQPNLLLVQDEGDVTFLVKVTDRPGAGVDGSLIDFRFSKTDQQDWSTWFSMNGSGISEEVVASITQFLSEGEYNIQFRTSDILGNPAISQPFDVKVQKKIVDQPPIPIISSPDDGQVIKEGTPIILNSEGTTDDGLGRYGELVYSWFSNISGFLGLGSRISVYLDQTGFHRITLYVDDGTPGHNISTSINLTLEEIETNPVNPSVNETDEDDPLMAVFVVSIITIVVLVVLFTALLLRYKKKREEEIVLAYHSRTEDDDLYEEKIEKEEREMGMIDDTRQVSQEEMDDQRAALYGEM